MKVAVVIACHVKNYELCYENMLENLIRPNNADMFFYIYSERYAPNMVADEKHPIIREWLDKPVTEEEIYNKYGNVVKAVKFITPNTSEIDRLVNKSRIDLLSRPGEGGDNDINDWDRIAVITQYFNRANAVDLVPNDYDIIVMSRPEIRFESPFIIDKLESNEIVIIGHDDWVCEQLFYGEAYTIRRLLYSFNEDKYKTLSRNAETKSPERLFAHFIYKNGYKIKSLISTYWLHWHYLPCKIQEGRKERIFLIGKP